VEPYTKLRQESARLHETKVCGKHGVPWLTNHRGNCIDEAYGCGGFEDCGKAGGTRLTVGYAGPEWSGVIKLLMLHLQIRQVRAT